MTQALVIGAGPAGLMAAETLGQAGLEVTIADAMPSVGRKFLMAGKSGLNLTKNEGALAFESAYGAPLSPALKTALDAFGPAQVISWAEGLGQPLFTGSTGRVFPTVMKASPLLRAWMGRLADYGVTVQTKWRWEGQSEGAHAFTTPDGPKAIQPRVAVLAMGGASWRRLGSDGAWARQLSEFVAPFAPANVGLRVKWSPYMAPHFGKPVKAVSLSAGEMTTRGEFVISERGLEGGGVYVVSRAVRAGAPLMLDLLPDWTEEKLRMALARPRGKTSVSNHLRKTLRLDPVRLALLSEFGRPFPDDISTIIKRLHVPHAGFRPIDEAISTAGGLRFDALTDGLMLKSSPGIFAAGEMLDWEAPTGGYLITACLATGQHAGRAAARYASGDHI